MTDLASLVIKLSAETSQYNASIQKATEQMATFGEQVSDTVKDVAKELLGLEALKEIFEFTENIVETIAHFEDLSHAVGATTEQLSQLSFAGKLEGIDDIAVPLEKLAHSVGEVATGNEQLINTFSALGVSVKDAGGKIKPTEQQLLDIADAVSKYNDGLAKTSAVQAIFGRSGADFIAFLDQGAEKIKEAQQEAIDLGVSVSTPTAKAANEFEQNMTRIGAAVEGVFFKTLEEVLPKFQEITDEIVAFSKNADNTQPIVEQLAALFKILASGAILLGTDFEVAGTFIGETAGRIGAIADEIEDLADRISHPVDSLNKFGEQAKTVFEEIANQILHPIDSLRAFSAQLDMLSDDIIKTFTHPIDAINDLGLAILHSPGLDSEIAQAKKGVAAIMDVWGDARDKWGEEEENSKPKLDLNLIDQTQIKAIESAIEALGKLDDALRQQVATYGLSGAAATVYDVTLGKLSASVDELDNKKPSQVNQALADLEKQGKLSKAVIDDINNALQDGVPPGDAVRDAIIGYATALDRLKGVDALSKLDSELLTMTGHLQEAQQAAFDLANRPLKITIQAAQDEQHLSGLDDSQKQIAVTSQINDLNSQAIAIQDALGKKIAEVDAAGIASGKGAIQIAGEEAATRQNAIAQLEALHVNAQALAETLAKTPGLPKEFAKEATEQALTLQKAIGDIQFNPKILEDVAKATQAQQKLNEAVEKQKDAAEDVALAMATLDKQHEQGSLTDLEFMAKQDEERQKQIADLEVLYQAQLKYADEVGDPKAIAAYKQTGVAIENLQAQMGQLAKTIRTDLTDDLTNAFVDFADGTKTAKQALQEFAGDFEKQMLQLAAKQLFQKLFESSGLSAGIDSLFGGAAKAASGLAGSTAAATTISTAMGTAATAGATALGTGITTGATAGATELGTAVTTAGARPRSRWAPRLRRPEPLRPRQWLQRSRVAARQAARERSVPRLSSPRPAVVPSPPTSSPWLEKKAPSSTSAT